MRRLIVGQGVLVDGWRDGWISPFKRTCAYGSSTCPVVLDCPGLRPIYQPSAGRTDSFPQQVTSSPYLP